MDIKLNARAHFTDGITIWLFNEIIYVKLHRVTMQINFFYSNYII